MRVITTKCGPRDQDIYGLNSHSTEPEQVSEKKKKKLSTGWTESPSTAVLVRIAVFNQASWGPVADPAPQGPGPNQCQLPGGAARVLKILSTLKRPRVEPFCNKLSA